MGLSEKSKYLVDRNSCMMTLHLYQLEHITLHKITLHYISGYPPYITLHAIRQDIIFQSDQLLFDGVGVHLCPCDVLFAMCVFSTDFLPSMSLKNDKTCTSIYGP